MTIHSTHRSRPFLLFIAAIMALSMGVFGCTDDDTQDEPGWGVGSGDSPDASVDDAGGDATTDDADAGSDPISCINGVSLGELVPGDSGTETVPLEATNTSGGCIDADSTATLQFSTDQPVNITFSLTGDLSGNDDFAIQSFNDRCDTDAAICRTGNTSRIAYDHPDGHAIELQNAGAASSLTLSYEVEQAVCGPDGDIGCDGGSYQVCHRGERIDQFDCAAEACDDATACGGNSCSEAIEVQPGTEDDPAVVQGHRRGYHDTGFFDDATLDDCHSDDTTVDEDSGEVFFAISEIPDGHDLVVESMEQGRHAFFVLAGCAVGRCLHVQSDEVVDHGDYQEVFNRLRYQPDGTADEVIVVVRAIDSFDRSFEFAAYFDDR